MFARVDVLFNNAAIGGAQKSVQELTPDQWDYVMDANLKGPFLCTWEAIKGMIAQAGHNIEHNYSIINISSVHESIDPSTTSALYAAPKEGIWKG